MGPKPDWSTLGARLKWLRESALKTSQRALLAKLKARGVDLDSHSSIVRYEADERIPGADYLRAMLEMTQKDATWLLLGKGKPDRIEEGQAQAALQTVGELAEMILKAAKGEVPQVPVIPIETGSDLAEQQELLGIDEAARRAQDNKVMDEVARERDGVEATRPPNHRRRLPRKKRGHRRA